MNSEVLVDLEILKSLSKEKHFLWANHILFFFLLFMLKVCTVYLFSRNCFFHFFVLALVFVVHYITMQSYMNLFWRDVRWCHPENYSLFPKVAFWDNSIVYCCLKCCKQSNIDIMVFHQLKSWCMLQEQIISFWMVNL